MFAKGVVKIPSLITVDFAFNPPIRTHGIKTFHSGFNSRARSNVINLTFSSIICGLQLRTGLDILRQSMVH